MQVGRSLYLLARHKAALEIYNEANKISPEEPELLHNQGVCLVYLKEYRQAKEWVWFPSIFRVFYCCSTFRGIR